MAGRVTVGIFPKLFLAMIIVAVIPVGAIWYVDYRASLERLTHDINQRLSTHAGAAVAYVDGWVEMNFKMLRQNAALDEMASMDPKKQRPILRSVLNEYRWIYLVFTVGLDGMNVARSDEEALRDYSDRVYVQRVLGGAPMGQQVVISRTTGQPSFILSVPIAAKGKLAGVLAVGTGVTELSGSVTNVRMGGTGYAFLVDETGAVIAHPTARGNLKEHPAVAGHVADAKKLLTFTDQSGKRVIAVAQKTKYGWTMITQQDYAEAYAPIHEANRNALILLGVTVLFVGVVSYLVARRVSRPIRNLTQIADNISRGNLRASIAEVNRSDEIGGLARAVERLTASVKLAMERLSKA